MTLPLQRSGPVFAVGGHHPAQLVAGQRRSGGAGPLPGRQQGGRAAEEAGGEGHVSVHKGGAALADLTVAVKQSQNKTSSHLISLWVTFELFYRANN